MFQLMAMHDERRQMVVLSFTTKTAAIAALRRFARSGYRCKVYMV